MHTYIHPNGCPIVVCNIQPLNHMTRHTNTRAHTHTHTDVRARTHARARAHAHS